MPSITKFGAFRPETRDAPVSHHLDSAPRYDVSGVDTWSFRDLTQF